MQGLAEQRSVSPSPRVLEFRTRMGADPQIPPEPLQQNRGQEWHNPQRQGNLSQMATVVVAALALLLSSLNTYLIWSARATERDAKVSDEHVNLLIDAKLNPALKDLNKSIDDKLAPITKQLSDLTALVNDAQGQLKRLQGTVDTEGQEQRQLQALARLQRDSEEILDAIRMELKIAEDGRRELPYGKLVDFKDAVHILPATAGNYWKTVAAIINYQSFTDQIKGHAPNPSTVSRECMGLTNDANMRSFGNTFSGYTLSNCVVDLDTQAFHNVVFKDSVVRYNGGPTTLDNVTFVNCRFVLSLESQQVPAKPELLFALLDSPNQTNVKVR